MAYLGGDQVLLFGGVDESPNVYNGETWVYDLSANTWTNQAPITGPSPRGGHAMAYLGGDQVLLFGGEDGSSSFRDDTWVYDLSANTWTNQAPATSPSARRYHTMASLGGDQVLLFGGWKEGYGVFGDTWVYDLSANTWTNQALVSSRSAAEWTAAAPSARTDLAMASLGGDRVVLFGGHDAGGDNSETWLATGFFTPVRVYLPVVAK